jgi:peptidylprolyl isomerase
MKQAQSGDRVTFHYTGTLRDGSEFDSSAGRDPLEVTIGTGSLLPAVEAALIGMAPGENKKVEVPCEEAYGPRREELVSVVAKEQIPDEIELEVGKALQAKRPDGEALRLVIAELREETVVLDANHPLAGEDLQFELKMLEVA